MGGIDTDYLVVGAGATGMVFADTLVAHSDADVVLVDRRDRPGGHWQDAYDFVRLHLPSAFYGCASTPLGGDGQDEDGFAERATGAEVRAHFARVLDDVLLPTGRVRFLGRREHVEEPDGTHRLVDLDGGPPVEVTVRRALVDATRLQGDVPATHRPSFAVEQGARCVPVGGLPGLGAPGERYTVLGSGKTAMDACLWLLGQGVEAGRVRWVRPRDPWVLPRAGVQPGAGVASVVEALSLDVEAVALAGSRADLFARLEAAGRLRRLDPAVEPTMYRCAIASDRELEELRGLEDVVRRGRVRQVQADRVVLEHGEVRAAPGEVVVDCTAAGVPVRPTTAVFAPGRVVPQQVRACSPSFNAALIGYVTATGDDVDEQNRLCPPHTYPTAPDDWLRGLAAVLATGHAWRSAPHVQAWVDGCRLDVAHGLAEHLDDPRLPAALTRFSTHVKTAAERLRSDLAPVPA